VRVAEGRLTVSRDGEGSPDATAAGDAPTFCALIGDKETVEAAEERGALKLGGDRKRFERLLAAVTASH
jgi:hypothetical protein